MYSINSLLNFWGITMDNLRVGFVENVFGEGWYQEFDVRDLLCGQIARCRIRQGKYLFFESESPNLPLRLTCISVKASLGWGCIVFIPQGVIRPDMRNPHLWWASEWYLPRSLSHILQNQ